MSFIPIIIEPYPDELLYSWVIRLAKANGVSVALFFDTYFGDMYFGKASKVPVNIKKGFNLFYDSLNCPVSISELYLSLSTIQFELLSYPQKLQTKFINHVFRKESKLNIEKGYLTTDFHMCKECMNEDKELFGETYIHRSHQLSGVCVCHKHHTPLFTQKTNRQHDYKDENLEQIELIDDFEKECKYADYTHFLLENNFQSNSNDLKEIIFNKLGIQESNKKEIVSRTNQILGYDENYMKHGPWFKKDDSIPIKDFIKVLMHAYSNPEDVLVETKKSTLIIERKCNECGRIFCTTEQGIKDGWGCTFCDDELEEVDLIKRLIEISGNGEYVFEGFLPNDPKNNILLLHKSCGNEFPAKLSSFIYNHTRCKCSIKMQRKEADKEMKQHPNFKLIEFNGATLPAKFYHKDCGREFDYTSFRWFLKVPKCPHCAKEQGFTKENFQQEIEELVGDEYTVCSIGSTRKEKVAIRHNVCGHVHEYFPHNFFVGGRCPNCNETTSLRELKIMLKEYSGDRYEIVGRDKEKYILHDKETDNTITMTNRLIIQEIKRPTPSQILPTNNNKMTQILSTWDFWYQLCIEYKNEFGHLCPKMNEKYNGYDIYSWTVKARQACNNGEFSQDRVQALKNIGFVFDTDFYKWEQRFNEYKEYVDETGNYFPSVREVHNGNKVGQWCRLQRKEKYKGKLKPKREEALLEYFPDFFKRKRSENGTRKKYR